jgi:hypothetical protein
VPKPQGVIAQWPVLPGTPTQVPPAGHVLVYYKSTDGKLYTKNSSGVEAPVDSGGGGGAAYADVDVDAPSNPAVGQLWLDEDEAAAGWNGTLVITLGATDPVPPGLPAGTVIFRRNV